jgi:uncharacterized C2H2 Zn-finger protein
MEAMADGKVSPQLLNARIVFSYHLPTDAAACAAECVRVHNSKGDAPIWANLLREIAGNPFRDPPGDAQVDNLRVCEKCHCRFNLTPNDIARCPRCQTDFVRKWRQRDEWLTWNDGMVRRIAESIYQVRAWDDMPILADALLEAGCTDEDIVRHSQGEERGPGDWHRCRGCGSVYRHIHKYSSCDNPGCEGEDSDEVAKWRPLRGPHCRGCFVIDALTGRT